MGTRLGNINLFVRDVAASVQFYTQVLGLMENTERSFPPHFALLEAGGATLTLQDSTAPEAGFGQASSVEIGFAVDDVEAVRGRFVQRGMQVDAVQQMGWGGGFNALDPDGHRLTIYRMREDES